MSAYTNRVDDYRGCDSLYRAGSIFSPLSQYSNESSDEDGQVIRATNAGNFGVTTPMVLNRPTPSLREPHQGGGTSIGRPPQSPATNGNDSDYSLPGIDDLLQNHPPELPKPELPKPAIPIVNPPVMRQISSETVPFSAQTGEPTFTVEELRRLDPSVTDIKILNVEDSTGSK